MATKVLAPKVSDWLRHEAESSISRAVKTVLSGQVLKCGQVACLNADGKVIALAATGNEVHTYTFTGTPTAGKFTMRLWHKDGYWVRTKELLWNDTTANVDAAVEAVLGTGAAVCVATGSGVAITVITLTYSGTGYASSVLPLGQVDIANLTTVTACTVARATSAGAARNEVQTFDFGVAATGGTIKVGIYMPTAGLPMSEWPLVFTDAAAWNATDATYLAAIQAVLDQVCGANGIVVSAKAATDTDLALVFTFSGTGFAGLAHRMLVVDTAALTSVTTVTGTRTTAGGTAGNRPGSKASLIAYEAIDASGGDVVGLFIDKDAIVNGDGLIYGGGDPDAVKTALEERRIYVRNEGKYMIPSV